MTKKCEPIQRLLDRYLRNELNPDDRGSVEAHVAECAGCRDALAYHRSLDARLAGMAEAPEGLRLRIEAALTTPAPRRSWLTQVFGDPTMKKILISSTAVATVLVGGFMLTPRQAQGATASEALKTMRKSLAQAAKLGQLAITCARVPEGLTMVSFKLNGVPLPPDVPVTIVNDFGPEYDDFIITIDLSNSTFSAIQFGQDHNTLKMVPKANPNNLDVIHIDPKTGLPTNWSTFTVRNGKLKPLTSVNFKTSDATINGPSGTAKTSTTPNDKEIRPKQDDGVICFRLRMAKYHVKE